MTSSFRLKDPQSILNWSIDWADWLQTAEGILSDSWTITPSGTLAESSSSTAGTVSTIYLTGGTVGETYRVTCTMVSDATPARTVERTITIRIGDR